MENKTQNENKTNMEVLRKLQKIEECQGLILNGLTALFSVVLSKEEEYDNEIIKTLKTGVLANTLFTDSMMKSTIERHEQHKEEKECVDSFIDLLESLL